MKICPQCHTEYEDNIDVCPKDDAVLEVEINEPFVSGEENVSSASTAETPKSSTVNASAAAKGGSALPKILALLGVLLILGIGLVVWKTKFAKHHDEVLTK
jgi:hypothetical protein